MDLLDFAKRDDPTSLRDLARTCRRFAERQIAVPLGERPQFRRDDFAAMAELGLTGAAIDERFGGTALSRLEIAAINFELSRIQLGPAIYLSVHHMVSGLLSRWPQGREDLLRKLATGEILGAFCLTEAQAGSDASALLTRADRVDGGYRLNGEKIYISSSSIADVYLVFARTGENRKEDISAFLVGRQTPGVTFGKPERKMGAEGSPIGNVTLTDCVVPESHLVGDEGEGYRIALAGLDGGRINIAACACGIASRAIELSIAHLRSRQQFGQLLSEFQGLQFMVADLYQGFLASVLLTREAAQTVDRGERAPLQCSVAKCFATDRAMEIATDAVQLFGGAGYLEDYGVERLMRDAKMLQIVEGTNQIQRLRIARELLG